jgi:uncharacterized cupredoxin-like copper-binding protein
LRLGPLLGVLVALTACSSGASAAPDAVRIEIRHSRFVPDSFSAASGTAVRIAVHNTDPIDHEFIVGDQATQDRHERGVDERHDGSVPGEISVAAGAVVVTTYRYDHSGQLLYGCHLPGHWAYGMRGTIAVSR